MAAEQCAGRKEVDPPRIPVPGDCPGSGGKGLKNFIALKNLYKILKNFLVFRRPILYDPADIIAFVIIKVLGINFAIISIG